MAMTPELYTSKKQYLDRRERTLRQNFSRACRMNNWHELDYLKEQIAEVEYKQRMLEEAKQMGTNFDVL